MIHAKSQLTTSVGFQGLKRAASDPAKSAGPKMQSKRAKLDSKEQKQSDKQPAVQAKGKKVGQERQPKPKAELPPKAEAPQVNAAFNLLYTCA